MLRFKNLGSGSKGNATVVEGLRDGMARRLLVDCGFGIRQLQARLLEAELQLSDIDAVFITHEHSDHIGCAQTLALRHGIPTWMSAGTHAALGWPDMGAALRMARDLEPIDLGTFEALPFTVPHDAREPLQLRCSQGTAHLGICTDLGHASDHAVHHLMGCTALLLEANHDSDMLASSIYPLFLQRRIGGRFGHLSNSASAQMLRALAHPGLTQVVAAHLSERNNTPERATQALAQALGWHPLQIGVAHPKSGTPWITVGRGGVQGTAADAASLQPIRP